MSMKHRLTIAGAGVVVLYLSALVVPIDPQERRPGTRLSGTIVEAPADWSASIAANPKIFVQTKTWYGIPHSVTTVSFALDGALYVPCARCPPKRWPKNVARDPDVVLKIGSSLYERRAVRVEDPALLQRLFAGRSPSPKITWLFRMDPRSDVE